MAILGVDDFKAKLTGGGARSNLFKVTVGFPSYAAGNTELTSFMCKSAQLPASTVAPIVIPFRGRQVYVAGDRTFEPATITVINDTNFAVRNAFERWSNGINRNRANTGFTNPADYMQEVTIEQLDKSGVVIKSYFLSGCFPTEISAIEVSYDNENAIEEFTVTMQIQYWTSGTTPDTLNR
jgi:hypothetical protein